MRLTPQHRKFCQSIAEGHSATTSYVVATGCENRETATRQGGRWLSKPEIQAEVARLVAQVQTPPLDTKDAVKNLVDRLEKRRVLSEIIRDDKLDAMKRMKAIELDNQMTGDNAPLQIESDGTLTVTWQSPSA